MGFAVPQDIWDICLGLGSEMQQLQETSKVGVNFIVMWKNLSFQDLHANTSGINTYLHKGLEHSFFRQTLFSWTFTESKQKGLWILAKADLSHVAEQV